MVMDKVTFQVNGIQHSVGGEVNSNTTLLDYLQRSLELRGNKYNCLEGGCGACIVSAVKFHGDVPRGVNSCMVSITSCQDWRIETIEKVGNHLDGYHPLQTELAKANGTQCGYCSPGMVMNMYSLIQSKQLTMLEIEQALGSNVCRCTGYRPILDAFKKFASDAVNPIYLQDIEDLKICDKSGKSCAQEACEQAEWCVVSRNEMLGKILHIELSDDRDWYRANSLYDVFDILKESCAESYMLVAGNTAKGVYPILEYPKLLIDISSLTELQGYYFDQNLILGAGTTLANVIRIFEDLAQVEYFSYLNVINKHLNLVAHVTIRNLATLAGNLFIKHQNPNFKSDIFLILETVGAQVTIMLDARRKQILSMQDFMDEDMSGKIIMNVILPPLGCENKLVTYKIMPRFQNAHAFVNAGFLYKIDDSNNVIESRIVYGGLSNITTRAVKTERYLMGKQLFTNETLKGALKVLNEQLDVVVNLPDPSVQYRQQAALGLFYKGLLSLCPTNIVNVRYRSGAIKLRDTRPVSKGSQTFDTDPALWPLNKPSPKFDGLIQCAGEAEYTEDIPAIHGEVYLAFVLAKVPLGKIEKINPSKALEQPGVLAFYSASDIPGVNNFLTFPMSIILAGEEIFCSGDVKCYDQPLGVIVAEDQNIANKAATLVEVEYSNVIEGVIDIKVAKNDPSRSSLLSSATATSTANDIAKIIKGNDTIYGQYHFPMETLVCIVRKVEEGFKLFSASQWIDLVQSATSRALNIEQNRTEVCVQRLGGAYGFKATRCSQVSVAAALAAYKLNRPCRFINPFNVNMKAMGKRFPCSRDYEVGVNSNGVIQYVNCYLYSDNGSVVNELVLLLGVDSYYNCYDKNPWRYFAYNTLTDSASNTMCRSPGTLENIAMAELMIERIAYELNLDPLEVRLSNLDTVNYSDMLEVIETIKSKSQYSARRIAIDTFNKNNRWKKRGLRFSFLKWNSFGSLNLAINLSVYADDGTVVITHGGVEMGQGINTKAIQVCAHLLNIPVDKIKIKPNNTVISPNSTGTVSSITSQNVSIGVSRCCKELLERLEPIRSEMSKPTWVELIKQAYASQVNLQVNAYTNSYDEQNYIIYGISLAEVEIDVLTGESQIIQVDIIQDVGQSVNPELDVGQVEGAFILGVGYWTSENLVYDPKTGELLTNRTWEYWVPQARDIPQVFNVDFRKRTYSTDVIFGAKVSILKNCYVDPNRTVYLYGHREPSTCMGIVVALALREAISQARSECGIPTTQWFELDGPYTVDKICVATATTMDHFKFN